MGDHHRGSALHQSQERVADVTLVLAIEAGCRLIEHEHGRVLQERPRDGYALSLTA